MNSSHNYVEETEISQQDTAVNLCDELQMKSSKDCNRKCSGCQSVKKIGLVWTANGNYSHFPGKKARVGEAVKLARFSLKFGQFQLHTDLRQKIPREW